MGEKKNNKHKLKIVLALLFVVGIIIYYNPRYETGNAFYNAILNWPYMESKNYPDLTNVFKEAFPGVKTVIPEITHSLYSYGFNQNTTIILGYGNQWPGKTLNFEAPCRCLLPNCLIFEECMMRVYFNLSDNGEINNIRGAVTYMGL